LLKNLRFLAHKIFDFVEAFGSDQKVTGLHYRGIQKKILCIQLIILVNLNKLLKASVKSLFNIIWEAARGQLVQA